MEHRRASRVNEQQQQWARPDNPGQWHLPSTTHNAEKEQLAVVQSDPDAELVQCPVARSPNVVQRGIETRASRSG